MSCVMIFRSLQDGQSTHNSSALGEQ